MNDFLKDAHVSATWYQVCLSLIPVLGLVLVMAGCAIATGRGISREIQRKDEARTQMARDMKPPLPESPLVAWWKESGPSDVMAVTSAIAGIALAWIRVGKGQGNV